MRFQALEEKEQYHAILAVLSEQGSDGEALRQEALRIFTLTDSPNFKTLEEKYNLRRRIEAYAKNSQYTDVDTTPYLSSFFEALKEELYADELFKTQISETIRDRGADITQKHLPRVADATERTADATEQIRDALAFHRNQYTDEQFERDKKAYVEWLEQKYRILRLDIVRYILEEQAYVYEEPSISSILVPFQVKLTGKKLTDVSSQVSVTELLINLRKSQMERHESEDVRHHLVLLGGPGQGKSTLIQYLVWCHAIANLSQHPAPLATLFLLPKTPIPLHIDLSQISKLKCSERDDFLSYIIKIMQNQGIKIQSADQMFKRLLAQEDTLLLFDGLDEITQDHHLVIEGIEEFARYYHKSTVIVTSRFVGYYSKPLPASLFSHAEIQAFDKKQIYQFLENWYKHVIKSSLHEDAISELEIFYNRLVNNPHLITLASSPLLLTIMTALYHLNPKTLPHKRVQVYEECARTLLEHWAKVRGTTASPKVLVMNEDEQYLCAARLGYKVHKHDQQKEGTNVEAINTFPTASTITELPGSNLSKRFIRGEIENFIKERHPSASWSEQTNAVKDFFELMQTDAGLLVKRGKDEFDGELYGFVHRTFQEYFAAVDIYERYQNDNDSNPDVISNFLQDCLHDPHWHEVILLLFEKLKCRVATEQLRQILEGKIQSIRSKYTDLMQQELFFVCSCLIEEIDIENELAELIVSHLMDLVKNSPFPSQQLQALNILASFMKTQQYANLGRKALIALVSQDIVPDLYTKVQAAENLYKYSPPDSEGRQYAIQMFLNLSQQPNLSTGQAALIAHTLYRICPPQSEEDQQITKVLFKIAQRPDLSIERVVKAAQYFHEFYNDPDDAEQWQQSTPILLGLAQRSDLSVGQTIQIAHTLYLDSHPKDLEKRLQATQMLLSLVQKHNLSVEHSVQIAKILYRYNSSKSEQAIQILLSLACKPNLSFQQTVLVAKALSECSQAKLHEQAARMLLDISQWPNLSIEQRVSVAKILDKCTTTQSNEQATEILLDLAQQSNLSVEQAVLVATALDKCSHTKRVRQSKERLSKQAILIPQNTDPHNLFDGFFDSEECRETIQMLMDLTERPDLCIEQTVLIAKTLYECGNTESKERAVQMLLNLAQRPDLSIEQVISIAEARYKRTTLVTPFESEERQQVSQILLSLTRRPNLSVEQILQITRALSRISLDESEGQQPTVEILMELAQRSDLSVEHTLQVAWLLYEYSPPKSRQQQQAAKMLWKLAQEQDLTLEQRLRAATVPLTQWKANYPDRVQAVQIVLILLQEKAARRYLAKHWEPVHEDDPRRGADISDIQCIAELAKQEILPTSIRDQMYEILNEYITQFDKIPSDQPTL